MGRVHDAREHDVVVALGGQVTAGLMALALQNLGINARSWLGWQVPIQTDSVHGYARIEAIHAADIGRCLAENKAAVVAGVQGVAPGDRIPTLGPGRSPTSAR